MVHEYLHSLVDFSVTWTNLSVNWLLVPSSGLLLSRPIAFLNFACLLGLKNLFFKVNQISTAKLHLCMFAVVHL